MIGGIVGSGHLVVSGGIGTHPYVSPGSMSAGMVRWNINTNILEVYDGVAWRPLTSGIASVDLTPTASAAITWAINKMAEEQVYKALADSHPAIKIAMENLEKAKQQLDATIILSKEHV